jgi:hypothetical protein
MVLGQPAGQCPSHRQRHDRDRVAPSRQIAVRGFGRGDVVGPPRGDHVFDGGPVTGQERELDGVPLGRHRLGQRPQGLGVACETVKDEDAARITVVGEGLGTGKDGGDHVEMLGHGPHRPARTYDGPRRVW